MRKSERSENIKFFETQTLGDNFNLIVVVSPFKKIESHRIN